MGKTADDHDYFDEAYVNNWAENELKKRPERATFFDAFVQEVRRLSRNKAPSILEIGSGPGFLAEQLLSCCEVSTYYLADISPFMLKLSKQRLKQFPNKTVFLEKNFRSESWVQAIPRDLDLVVSLQAVHEVGQLTEITKLYGEIYQLLASGGCILVCDLVSNDQNEKPHRITTDAHLKALEKVGFRECNVILSIGDLSLVKGNKV